MIYASSEAAPILYTGCSMLQVTLPSTSTVQQDHDSNQVGQCVRVGNPVESGLVLMNLKNNR